MYVCMCEHCYVAVNVNVCADSQFSWIKDLFNPVRSSSAQKLMGRTC